MMKLDFKNYPAALKIVCIIVLLPILAAPLVFYSTIFFFDNPSNVSEAFAWFVAVNSYSFILLGICWVSVWMYSKYRRCLPAILPFLFYLGVIYVGYWYFTDGPIDKKHVTANDYRLYRNTPCEELAKAINRQNVQEIDRILSQSPELLSYKESKFNQSILFYAISDDKIRAVEALLKHGANPNQVVIDSNKSISIPISDVCGQYWDEDKKIKYVRLLLEYGADINIAFVNEFVSRHCGICPLTPLEAASQQGDLELVRYCLANGADPNFRFKELNSTSLEIAILFRHYTVAEELLKHGADPDLPMYERRTSVRKELIDEIKNPVFSDSARDLKAKRRLLKMIEDQD
ncbi:ankyrin repeat domain-containing protein [Phocaeicola coprocola]|uniref:ankyrin repeat domain-containing protein n=1 Tax=Phocaeicola coprocola TaxID=310298 RepID=UPI00399627D6